MVKNMNIENPSFEDIINALNIIKNVCNKYWIEPKQDFEEGDCSKCPLRNTIIRSCSGPCSLDVDMPCEWKIKTKEDITLFNVYSD